MSVLGRVAPFLMGSTPAAGAALPIQTGLLIDLDASDASTITLNMSGSIDAWLNRAPSAESFTVPGNNPTVDTTSFSINSIAWGGNASYFTNATGVSIPESSTVYMVLYWGSGNTDHHSMTMFKGTANDSISAGTGRAWWGVYKASGTAGIGAMQQSATVYTETSSAVQTAGTRGLWTFKNPDPNTSAVIRLDLVDQTLTQGGDSDVPSGMVINSIGSVDSTYVNNGSIAQIAVYDSVHSASDMATIEAHLKAKWGTP